MNNSSQLHFGQLRMHAHERESDGRTKEIEHQESLDEGDDSDD